MRALRWLRGMAGTMLVWALAWAVAGAGFGAVHASWFHWTRHGSFPNQEWLTRSTVGGGVFFAILGAMTAVVFGVALSLLERRRSVEDLPVRRVAAVGALCGMAHPLLSTVLAYALEGLVLDGIAFSLVLTALLGGGCAAGTLALARRPPRAALPR